MKTYGPNNPPRLRRPNETVEQYRSEMGWNNNEELPGIPKPPKPRGRPRKADALSNAERQAAYRRRQKEAGTCPGCGQKIISAADLRKAEEAFYGEHSNEVVDNVRHPLDEELQRLAWLEFGRRNGWL